VPFVVASESSNDSAQWFNVEVGIGRRTAQLRMTINRVEAADPRQLVYGDKGLTRGQELRMYRHAAVAQKIVLGCR